MYFVTEPVLNIFCGFRRSSRTLLRDLFDNSRDALMIMFPIATEFYFFNMTVNNLTSKGDRR